MGRYVNVRGLIAGALLGALVAPQTGWAAPVVFGVCLLVCSVYAAWFDRRRRAGVR